MKGGREPRESTHSLSGLRSPIETQLGLTLVRVKLGLTLTRCPAFGRRAGTNYIFSIYAANIAGLGSAANISQIAIGECFETSSVVLSPRSQTLSQTPYLRPLSQTPYLRPPISDLYLRLLLRPPISDPLSQTPYLSHRDRKIGGLSYFRPDQ